MCEERRRNQHSKSTNPFCRQLHSSYAPTLKFPSYRLPPPSGNSFPHASECGELLPTPPIPRLAHTSLITTPYRCSSSKLVRHLDIPQTWISFPVLTRLLHARCMTLRTLFSTGMQSREMIVRILPGTFCKILAYIRGVEAFCMM
jgi:hypothetical protein